MKDSINQGGVKDVSESLLRAFNGAPRCAPNGERDIIYDYEIIYSASGSITIRPPFGTTGITPTSYFNPPFGLPFGRWLLNISLNMTSPVPAPFKLGLGQNVSAPAETQVAKGRFMTTALGWDKVVVSQVGGGSSAADVAHSWHTGNAQFSEFNGPELFALVDWDFGTRGAQAKDIILPEQNEFCAYQFCPYLFTKLRVNGVSGSGSNWKNSIDQAMLPVGWQLLGVANSLYPNNTKIGTLQLRFRRLTNTPLFTFTVSPITNVRFTNRSIFNPALPLTYDWDFGDGSGHSASQNPVHNYPSTGKYTATLTTTDAVGTKQFNQIVTLPLKAIFTYATRPFFANGPVTMVTPADQSLGATNWDWDWGDGSPHSNTQLTEHYYPRNRVFTITLTVSDGTGKTDSVSQVVST